MTNIVIRKHISIRIVEDDKLSEETDPDHLRTVDIPIVSALLELGYEVAERETRVLPMKKFAIGRCENCDRLMLNRDRNPSRFGGDTLFSDLDWVIRDGGEEYGRVLCQECLSVEHRWGNFS